METIGDRIRTKREELCLTQVALGLRLECTGRAIQKWESGKAVPYASSISKLANVLGVSTSWLRTGEGPTVPTIVVPPIPEALTAPALAATWSMVHCTLGEAGVTLTPKAMARVILVVATEAMKADRPATPADVGAAMSELVQLQS